MAARLPELRVFTCPACRGTARQRDECGSCCGTGESYEAPPAACPWCHAPAVHRFNLNSARPGPDWYALYTCAAEYGAVARKGCTAVPLEVARVVADVSVERGLALMDALGTNDAAMLLEHCRASWVRPVS